MMTAFFHQLDGVVGKRPLSVLSVALLVILLLAAVLGPLMAPYDPMAGDIADALQPPSKGHWFGTDGLGRDVLSRLIASVRFDLGIAIAAVILSCGLGSGLGSLAGFYGGWTGWMVSRITHLITAFPMFILAIGIVVALGNHAMHMIYALAIIHLPFYIHAAQAQANDLSHGGFVAAARLSGHCGLQRLTRALLPNMLPPMIAQVWLSMGSAMLHGAGLSFIGLGVPPPPPSWGLMMAEGAPWVTTGEWWPALFPGAALMLAVWGCHVLGDGVRSKLDLRT